MQMCSGLPSHSHGLEYHSFGALAVPFAIENPLPGSQIEPALGDRNDYFVTNGERTKVRRGVVLTGSAVMPIVVRIPGRDVFEPLQDVLPQIRFVVVDEDRSRYVHR